MPPRVLLAYALLCVLWGSTWGAIKIGVAQVPAFLFAFDRAAAVAVILIAVSLILRQPFPRGRRTFVAVVFAGVVNIGVSWAILFWAEQYVPSGLAAIFGSSAPIWAALMAHFFVPDDRLNPLKAVGLALGVAGTALLIRVEEVDAAGPVALATILLALMPVAWGAAAVVSRLELQRVAAVPTTALQASAGALVLLPFALGDLSRSARWDVTTLAALGYLVVFGTCVGFAIFVWLLQRLRPTTVLLQNVIVPGEAVFIGAVLLGEEVTWRLLIGLALIGAAVLLNALSSRRPDPRLAIPASAVGED